jgi:hypothetical protein
VNGDEAGTSIQIGIPASSPSEDDFARASVYLECVDSDDGAGLALLFELGTDRMPHGNRRTLYEHLVGMATIAAAWGLSETVRRAALFHSVYGTSAYRGTAAGLEARRTIARAIGDDAERLAHAFGDLDRRRFREAIATMSSAALACTLTMRSGDVVHLSADDVTALTLLGIVNEVEQTCADDGGPARWRACCPSLVSALARWTAVSVPTEVRASLDTSQDVEEAVIADYRAALLSLADDIEGGAATAIDALRAASDAPTYVAEPVAWRAYLQARAGDARSARHLVAKARRRFAIWGTPWDKRLPLGAWYEELDRIEAGSPPAQLERLLSRR